MTQEQKDLLLNDFCARLPYGVKCKVWYNDKTLNIKCTSIDFYTNTVNLDIPEDDNAKVYIDNIKLYLFPLSSMTEEQDREFSLLQVNTHKDGFLYVCDCTNMITWLNKNHFDYRGLIPKGLAIDCTELNIYV